MIEEYSKNKKEQYVLRKKIAKQIFDEMKKVCDKWESFKNDLDIDCNWDHNVTFEGYTFNEDHFNE